MTFSELIDLLSDLEADGYTVDEALDEIDRIKAENHRRFIEDYENEPEVQYGWYQQDMIDLRYRER